MECFIFIYHELFTKFYIACKQILQQQQAFQYPFRSSIPVRVEWAVS